MPLRSPRKKPVAAGHSEVFVSIFPTNLGWMAIVGCVNGVRSILVGHSNAASLRKDVAKREGDLVEADWRPELKASLQAYACGERVSFAEFPLELPDRTPFRDKVLAVTRQLGYGQTISYGELARKVGHPGAARAVGTVMSKNRFPIVIPCHRVLAAGNKLGGFTCPAGTDFKLRLLELECPKSYFG